MVDYEIKHYKVLKLPNKLTPNVVYYVLDQPTGRVKAYISDLNGIPIPLLDLTTVGSVKSVTGTGVTGPLTVNPRVDIVNFISSQLGNQVHLSTVDGRLNVKPTTSPDGSVEITKTDEGIQIKVSETIQNTLNSLYNLEKTSAEVIPSHTPVAIVGGLAYKMDSSVPAHQFAFAGFSMNGTLAGEICKIKERGELTLSGWGLLQNSHYLSGPNGTLILDNTSNSNFTKIIAYATSSDSLKIISEYTAINK